MVKVDLITGFLGAGKTTFIRRYADYFMRKGQRINIIENDKIVEKRTLKLPDVVTNIIKCKNPRCITSIEQELPHRFKLTDQKNRIYRCMYCEQKFKGQF